MPEIQSVRGIVRGKEIVCHDFVRVVPDLINLETLIDWLARRGISPERVMLQADDGDAIYAVWPP